MQDKQTLYKPNRQCGKCNRKRPVNTFWFASPAQEMNTFTFKTGLLEDTEAVQREYHAKTTRMEDLEEEERLLSVQQSQGEELK